jgi:hypothetical protein
MLMPVQRKQCSCQYRGSNAHVSTEVIMLMPVQRQQCSCRYRGINAHVSTEAAMIMPVQRHECSCQYKGSIAHVSTEAAMLMSVQRHQCSCQYRSSNAHASTVQETPALTQSLRTLICKGRVDTCRVRSVYTSNPIIGMTRVVLSRQSKALAFCQASAETTDQYNWRCE